MKIETREDALLHCFDLWLWLAVTGNKNKENWPGWENNDGYLEWCYCDCPMCDFVGNICSECVINWANKKCYRKNGEFNKWIEAETKQERTKWALKIATLALNALLKGEIK